MAAKSVTSPLVRFLEQGMDWRRSVPRSTTPIPISPAMRNLLAKPSWSVRSLLPPQAPPQSSTPGAEAENTTKSEITREKLHHLLRLSALPLPKSEEEEKSMLKTLESQIHFVKEIQKVDTTGVEPLQVIRDETDEAIEEQTVRLEDLMPYLEMEEKVGKNGTVRRRKDAYKHVQEREKLNWNPFELGVGSEERKKMGGGGRYFVVKKKRSASIEEEKSPMNGTIKDGNPD